MAEPIGPNDSWPFEWEVQVGPTGMVRITRMSQDLVDLYGYGPGELQTPDAWRALIPPEEQSFIEAVQEEVLEGAEWQGRVRVTTKDGSEVVIETTVELDHQESGGTIIKGRARDVTEHAGLVAALEEREVRLKVLNENLRLIMWSCDPRLRFTWIWGSGLADLGLGENELVGTSLFEYYATEDPSYPAIKAEQEALEGETVHYELSWKGRLYRCSVEPHLGPLGEVLGTFGTAIDMTEQRFLEIETHVLGKEIGATRLAAEASWETSDEEVIQVGPLTIHPESYEVFKDGTQVELTPTEFRLLTELARRPGHALTRQVLLARVWGHEFLGSGSLITMAIRRLRNKIEADPANPCLIETVRGVGYRLRAH